MLDRIERCVGTVYNVCTDPTATRNVFDRPATLFGLTAPRAITWNPALRTEVELKCAANPAEPLLRDPTASLLHELVHAAQDCDGLNPGEHELEAVRIENIYRRAAGLCQRTGYGDERLPRSMLASCNTGPCSCSSPLDGEPEERAPTQAMARGSGPAPSSLAPASGLNETSGDRAIP